MTTRAASGCTRVAALACAACVCAHAARAQSRTEALTRPAAVGVRRAPTIPMPAFQSSGATSNGGKPSLDVARVAGEVLAGSYAGIAGYFVGSWITGFAAERIAMASEGTKDQITFVGGVVGAGVATAASVSAVGNIGDQTGSFQAALVGTAAGVATGLMLNQLLYGHARLPREEGSSRIRWLESSFEALLPSIGATIAFNSTRKFK